MRIRFLPLLFLVSTVAYGQAGILNSTRVAGGTGWSRASVGVPGGIPSASWMPCATVPAYSGSAATINSAIAACGNNQYVHLGTGTFTISGCIDYSSKESGHFAVRGDGPKNTQVAFTNGCTCYSGEQMVCMYGSGLNPTSASVQPGGTHAFSWTGGFSQGATSLTIASVGSAGLQNGDIIVLDQANDQSDNGGEVICDQNVNFTCLTETNSYVGRTIGGIDYQQQQLTNIVSGCPCSGPGPFTITIGQGLYANNWNGTGAVGGWWATPQELVGIENLTLDDSGETCAGTCGIIAVNDVDSWWVKNVRTIKGGRNHVVTQLASRGEIRDSYFYGVKGGSTQSYGLELGAISDSLIENNIFQQISSPNIGPGASSGNVWGYNFAIDDYYCGAVPPPGQPCSDGGVYLQVPYFNHDAGNSFNLYEGNQFPSLAGDDTHGTSALDTAFRNRFNGRDYNTSATRNNQPSAFTQAMSWNSYNRGYNVIGNVLGTPGYHVNYQAVATDTSGNDTATQAFCNTAIYDIGSGAGVCRGGAQFGESIKNDPIAVSSMMRWGNYDTATAGVRWDATESSPGAVAHISANTTPASHTLPNSFYQSGMPSFWTVVSGTQPPWPAIGPDVTGGPGPAGHSYNIPAANCFFAVMGGPTDGGGAVLPYDANACYNFSSLPSATTPTFSPSSGTAPQTVTVTAATGTVICYNFVGGPGPIGGGTTCPPGSTKVTGTVSISMAETIFAVAGGPSLIDSPIGSATYGGTPPTFSVSPTSFNFGSWTVGAPSNQQIFTVTNTGGSPLNICSPSGCGVDPVDFVGGTAPGDFLFLANDCAARLGGSLPASASCTITTQFQPSASGSRTTSMKFLDNASGNPHTVALSGTGGSVPVAGLSSLTASFTIAPNTVGSSTITLTNTGAGNLVMTSTAITGPSLTIFSNTCTGTIAPNATCTTVIHFSPAAAGISNGTLTYTDNATPSTQTVTITGNAVVSPPGPPPAGLVIGAASKTVNGTNTTINAAWTDAPSANSYTLFGSGKVLLRGINASSMSWTGRTPIAPLLCICDSLGSFMCKFI